MKKIAYLTVIGILPALLALSQPALKHSPAGFDTYRAGIAHGKLDTVTYNSKTVDSKRRAVVYLPPGYTAKKHILFCTCCMVLAAMNLNGLTRARPR